MPRSLRVPSPFAFLLLCACATAPSSPQPSVSRGRVAPGFEEVAAEFERNFAERGELGAAVAAYYQGEKVVDLWGGHRDLERTQPWTEETMLVVFSTTKGLAALTLALAHARGWLDYEAPVARYWPEFAQNGKAGITVRQLLGHQAGLVLLDEELPVERMRDLDWVASVLARQRPSWPPGTRHGYHAATIGLYMNELLRRVDPQHRSLGRFFQEEIARPLALDFHIGLPDSVPEERLATLRLLSPVRGLFNLGKLPGPLRTRVLSPWSYFNKSLAIPSGYDPNQRHPSLEIELAAGNGVGTVRSIARAFSEVATGGAQLGLSTETLEALFAVPSDPAFAGVDEVMGITTFFSLGFMKPSPGPDFGSSRRTVGSSGAGGSFAFADPDKRLSYAYAMNRMDFYVGNDPREESLRKALYRCVARLERKAAGAAPPAGATP